MNTELVALQLAVLSIIAMFLVSIFRPRGPHAQRIRSLADEILAFCANHPPEGIREMAVQFDRDGQARLVAAVPTTHLTIPFSGFKETEQLLELLKLPPSFRFPVCVIPFPERGLALKLAGSIIGEASQRGLLA